MWLACAACMGAPPDGEEPVARLVITWDPRACRGAYRVVVEIGDGSGDDARTSAPCALGGVAVDLPALGVYRGRIYAWSATSAIRSISPLEITVDQPIVHHTVEAPR